MRLIFFGKKVMEKQHGDFAIYGWGEKSRSLKILREDALWIRWFRNRPTSWILWTTLWN